MLLHCKLRPYGVKIIDNVMQLISHIYHCKLLMCGKENLKGAAAKEAWVPANCVIFKKLHFQ